MYDILSFKFYLNNKIEDNFNWEVMINELILVVFIKMYGLYERV